MPSPTPMDLYRAGLFRLAGFGGAALFLRSGIMSAGAPPLVLDVGLLTPDDYVWFRRLPMTQGLSGDLSRFFFSCASDMAPELTVASVDDPLSGLEVSVSGSTDSGVGLEVHVRGDSADGIGFTTSRVVLIRAADEVRALEAAVADDIRPTPPLDW